MSDTQEKLEQPTLKRILYIGEVIPESIANDKRSKFVLLGTPQDWLDELSTLIDSAKREGAEDMLDTVQNVLTGSEDFRIEPGVNLRLTMGQIKKLRDTIAELKKNLKDQAKLEQSEEQPK